MDTSAVSWEEVADHVNELSQAELVRAAEAAAKRAIREDGDGCWLRRALLGTRVTGWAMIGHAYDIEITAGGGGA